MKKRNNECVHNTQNSFREYALTPSVKRTRSLHITRKGNGRWHQLLPLANQSTGTKRIASREGNTEIGWFLSHFFCFCKHFYNHIRDTCKCIKKLTEDFEGCRKKTPARHQCTASWLLVHVLCWTWSSTALFTGSNQTGSII